MGFRKTDGWVEAKQLDYLLRELARSEADGRLSPELRQELLTGLELEQERRRSELAGLKEQQKLRLGRRLLMFFGSGALALGLGFFILDHYDWFSSVFEFIRQLVDIFLRMPPQVRALELLAATGLLFWVSLSRRESLEKSAWVFVCLGLAGLLFYDAFVVPDWLFGGSYTHWEHLLAGVLLFGWGYRVSLRTVMYAGLILTCGWLGGGTEYDFACYVIWMKDPVLFLPFSACLLTLGAWIERYGNKYAVAPVEITALLGLFLALLILSIGGYDGHPSLGLGPVSAVWFVVLLTVVSCAAVAVGIKYGRSRYYGFGLTFLSIDLYTRFYEIFNGWLPRSLFWLIFGALLLIGGRYVNRLIKTFSLKTV
ncbi:MAG: hypothetical protein HKL90_04470 [Elusimicrobia bacterium]|nr:hypothetical protein [Elusimicrobiota bacterium]